MPFYPGPGLGGHCIPVDPHYLSWKMKALNFSARFIELAGEVNSHMPEFVVQKTIHLLNEQKKSVKGAKILLLGMTYKPNVSDLRESPSLDVYQLLRDEGAKIAYHDPYVPRIDSEAISAKSVRLTPASLSSYDVVILLTAHASYDADFLLRHAKCLFDTRNITRGKKNKNLSRL
jgi:nucleotide sugar dehydrogenase